MSTDSARVTDAQLSIAVEIARARRGDIDAACAPLARRIRDEGLGAIGFAPANDRVAVPALLIQVGAALTELTGNTVAIVDANVRYPALAAIDVAHPVARGDSVFSTRWLRGSLALLTPPRAERAGDVLPQLERVLGESGELFAHVLVDLTGFELIGEHAAAAARMDAVALVGRAHDTREHELLELATQLPAPRFLGVLLVG